MDVLPAKLGEIQGQARAKLVALEENGIDDFVFQIGSQKTLVVTGRIAAGALLATVLDILLAHLG